MSSTTLLQDWLAHRAANTPDRTALVFEARSWSYAELDHEVRSTARRLASVGVGRDDRVAMLLHNSADAAILIHAVVRLGAALVPLNVRLTPAELEWQIHDCDPRVVLVESRTAPLIAELHEHANSTRVVSIDDLGPVTMNSDPLRLIPETEAMLLDEHAQSDVLAVVYTSGTTGRPKGAMLTVGNFWWSAIGSALNLGTHTGDRWLACMPLFHVGGLSILLRSAIYGITAVVHDGFEPDPVNRAIEHDGITIVSVVAVMLQRMLDARGATPYPASLRCVLLGGGAAPLSLLQRCAGLGVPVSQTYGLTETTSQLATLPPSEASRKLGAAGRPIYPNRVRIVTEGRDAKVGEAGEIVVSGPVVMAGYAGQPDATARAVVDGWLHTGDAGTVDEDGYLYVLDRRDDLIITGGENVYPAEVESVLLAHPRVAEAGVVGVSDDTWGHAVVAFVRLANDSASEHGSDDNVVDALRAHCRSQLAAYKTPRVYHVVTEPLPRTASGKIRRAALREEARSRTAGEVPPGDASHR
ncbi:MAG: o-succinylbenzoate--CoA ligase [Gemmatimonadota bacterium]|nr:o-succinylbenzoate--CoA ligase [Gemmatimonadota bacterium]